MCSVECRRRFPVLFLMQRTLLLAAGLAAASVSASAVTFSDSSFANLLWSGQKVAASSTPSTNFTAGFTSSFGGRSNVRLVTHTFGPADPIRSDITTFHALNAAVLNPAVSGSVTAISISFDINSGFGGTSGGVGRTVAVLQGGTVFTAQGSYATVFTGTGWQSVSLSGLTASSFTSSVLTNPDFSAAGAPIQVGIVLSNGSSLGVSTSSQTYLDNFSTDITAIPEPAAVATGLGGLALAVAAWRRRRAA